MELNCPSCAHLNRGFVEVCEHCGGEIGVFWEIESAALEHLLQARHAFAQGDAASAMGHSLRSWEMKHTARSAAIAALAAVMLGDLETAHLWLEQFDRVGDQSSDTQPMPFGPVTEQGTEQG